MAPTNNSAVASNNDDSTITLNSFSEIREKLAGGYYKKISEKFKAD